MTLYNPNFKRDLNYLDVVSIPGLIERTGQEVFQTTTAGIPRGVTEGKYNYWENLSEEDMERAQSMGRASRNPKELVKLTSVRWIDLMLQDHTTGEMIYSKVEAHQNHEKAHSLLRALSEIDGEVVLKRGMYCPHDQSFNFPEELSYENLDLRLKN